MVNMSEVLCNCFIDTAGKLFIFVYGRVNLLLLLEGTVLSVGNEPFLPLPALIPTFEYLNYLSRHGFRMV